MGNEQMPISLDDLPIQRQAIQLHDGSIVDCYKSRDTGEWYYLIPAVDEIGNPIIENDMELVEKVKLAA